MKNVKLKDVLKLKKVEEGIKANLIKEEYAVSIERTLKNRKENAISVLVVANKEICFFENTLHADYDKKVFLLESRLFRRIDGSMVNAYLELLDENLNVIEDCVDDVWSYADFVVVE